MWQPSAPLNNLKIRAKIIKQIRDFFFAKNILEVETPLLCHTSVTDPYIQSIPAFFQAHPQENEIKYYLQTSPEYAMKRLLAAQSGPIFQITKAFRQGEVGRFHNPEFTMLEWYRPGFDHHHLMDEMDELLQLILKKNPAERKTYAELFQSFFKINPHEAQVEQLKNIADDFNLQVEGDIQDKDTWLNLLMSYQIEPQLGQDKPCFVYDFPASQAALAKIIDGVAARFEVYVNGIELANGFYELQDAKEQRKRFENNLLERKKLGLPDLRIDENFLAALESGLPNCAGVALGIDRLIMIAADATRIGDVISFDFKRV